MTSISKKAGETVKRRFPNGIQFKTLCGDCNSSLGGSEDKAILSFYQQAHKFAYSQLRALPELVFLDIQPNLIIRGIYAHLLSSNDDGVPSYLDDIVRKVFSGELPLRQSPLRVYYWRYGGKWLTIVRNVSVNQNFGNGSSPDWLNLLKLKPLAFAVTNSESFRGLPCLNDFITAHDSLFSSLPLRLARADMHPHWPATVGQAGIMLAGENSGGLVATPLWRSR